MSFFSDAMTVIGFLKHYGLDKDYKVNFNEIHSVIAKRRLIVIQFDYFI